MENQHTADGMECIVTYQEWGTNNAKTERKKTKQHWQTQNRTKKPSMDKLKTEQKRMDKLKTEQKHMD